MTKDQRKSTFQMKALTAKQRQLFNTICEMAELVGPTFRQLQKRSSYLSTRSIGQYLDVLERRGYIKRIKGQARNIRILKPNL